MKKFLLWFVAADVAAALVVGVMFIAPATIPTKLTYKSSHTFVDGKLVNKSIVQCLEAC